MKKSLYVAVFLMVLVPSVTFAAWYNPLSWFRKAPVSVTMPVEMPIEATAQIIAPVALPVSKPVITNTITVTDPKLQSQINELAKSNTDLQIQLASLTTKYNVLVASNTNLLKENASLNSQISDLNNTTVQPISIQQSENQLIVTGGKTIKFENNSDQTVTIVGFTFTRYGSYTNKTNVGVSLSSSNIVVMPYDLYDGKAEVNLPNPLILSAHSTGYVYTSGDADTVSMIFKSRVMDVLGLPINLY